MQHHEFETIDSIALTKTTGGTHKDTSWPKPNDPLINNPNGAGAEERGGRSNAW